MTIEKKTFVCSDSLNNNNKFWEYEYNDSTNECTIRYGRVGKTAQTETKTMSRSVLDSKIREKLKARGKEGTATYKPPYKEIAVMASVHDLTPVSNSSKDVVLEAAKQQLIGENSVLSKLVERLVEVNKHELMVASGGQLNLDLKTGIISTPVGVITKDMIVEARKVLANLAPLVTETKFDEKEFIVGLNDYLMLVPQAVNHNRGWHKSFFTANNTLQKQSSLLDQLDASASLAADRLELAKKSSIQTTIATTPNLFDAKLSLVEDKSIINEIEKLFLSTLNNMHECRDLRPVNVYTVDINGMKNGFESDGSKLINHKRLWHGTRIFNVLSILKHGLVLPKTLSTMQIAGALFGNGLYFSDQSSKSLNYSYGYWDHKARDTNCFMFLCDVALGKSYTPTSRHESFPKSGYDSTFAEAHKSGVLNNEFIVYRTTQANLKYLVEFDKKVEKLWFPYGFWCIMVACCTSIDLKD